MCHAPKRHGNHTTILQSDWSKDNRKNHEGPEGSKRTNQMRRNITCKIHMEQNSVFHVGRAFMTTRKPAQK